MSKAKNILESKVYLDDGSHVKVFGRTEGEELEFYDCFACRVGKLPGLTNLIIHANGKRHNRNVTKTLERSTFYMPINDAVRIVNKEPAGASSSRSKPKIDPKLLELSSNLAERDAYSKTKFKVKFRDAEENIKHDYSNYKKVLDSHPKYSDEWKKYWEKEYKKIKSEGRYNPNDFDYKPGWIAYWKVRLDDLMKEEIEKRRKILLDQFGLDKNYRPKSRSPLSSNRHSRTRSSTYSSDDSRSRSPKRKENQIFKSSRSSARNIDYVEIDSSDDEKDTKKDENVTFISVCRLLSALEVEVGALTPKVLEMLTQSLQVEKSNPHDCDRIMMTSENHALLETVKEKLKGLVQLEIIDKQRKGAVQRAIQNIATLLHKVKIDKPSIVQTSVQVPPPKAPTSIDAEMKKRWKVVLASMGRMITDQEGDVLVEILKEELQKLKIEQSTKNLLNTSIPSTSTTIREEKAFSNEFKDLSDADLLLLLTNFSELEITEQNHMVSFLTYLEKTNPERIRTLKMSVDIDNIFRSKHGESDEDVEMEHESITDGLLNF